MATNNDLGSLSYSLNIDISQLPDTIRNVEKQLSGISTVADISTRVDSNQLIGAIKQALMAEDFKLKVTLDDSFKNAISNAASLLNNATNGSGGTNTNAQLGYIDTLIQKLKELETQYKNLPKGADTSGLVQEFSSVQAELNKAGKNLSSVFNKSWSDINKMAESTIGDLKSKIKSLEQYKLNIPLSNPAEITRVSDLINKLKGDISSLFQTQQVNPFQLPENSIKEIEAKIKALREVKDFAPINSQSFIDAEKAITGLRDKLASIGQLNLQQAFSLPEQSIEEIKRKLKEIEALKIKAPISSSDFSDATKEVERLKKLLSDINNPPKANRSFAEVMGMDTNTLNQITEKLNEIRRLRGEININNPNGISQLNSLNKAEADLLRLQQQRLSVNKQINETYASQASLVDNLTSKALAYFSLEKMQQFANKLIEIRGEFEKQQVALQVILQSKDQADKLFSQVVDLGLKSPFSIMQLNSYVKGLAAYRIETDQLFNTTKRLADISSGLGVDMGRLILAYGQVRAASVLRGQEVRQFTEAGIPLIEALADQFTKLEGRVVSTNEVFDKISNRLVPFEMVRDVLFEMTDAGGVFFNMQEKQAETLGAKWKNLQDAIDVMYNSIGQDNEGFLKGMAEGLTSMTENWRVILDYIESAIVALGTYKALSIAAGSSDVLVKSLMATRNVSKEVAEKFLAMQTGVSGGFNRIGLSVRALSASFKSFLATNGWTLLAAAIAGVAMKLYNAYQESKRFKEELDGIASAGVREAEALVKAHDALIKKLKDSVEGTVAYKEAMSQLSSQFGEYYDKMQLEAEGYAYIARNAKYAAAAIRDKMRMSAMEKAQSKVEDKYGGDIDEALSDIIKGLQDPYKWKGKTFDNSSITDQHLNRILEMFDKRIANTGSHDAQYYGAQVRALMPEITKEYGLNEGQAKNLYQYANEIGEYLSGLRKYNDSLSDAAKVIDARYNASESMPSVPGDARSPKQLLDDFNEAEKKIKKSLEDRENQIRNSEKNENIAAEKINQARADSYKELKALSKSYSNYKLSEYDAESKRVEVTSSKIRDAVKKTLGYDSKYFSPFSAFTDAKSMQDAYKSLKETLADPTKSDEIVKDAKDRVEALKKVAGELGVNLDPKSSEKAGKEAEDARLAKYKAEIALVKEANGAYKKYLDVLDESNAKAKVEENFAAQFKGLGIDIKYASNELAYYQSISDKLSKGTSKKDVALWNSVNKEIGGTQSEEEIEALKKQWQDLNDLFDLKKEAYALRDMYMQKGVSKEVSESFVKQIYGDIPLEFDNFQDDVSAKLSDASSNWGSDAGKAFKKRFGQEAKNSFLEMLDKFQTTQQKIDGINYKYTQIFKDLETQKGKVSAEVYAGMVANAETAKAEELAAVTATAIQMTDAYQRMFGNISEMSEKELNYLIQKWKTALAEAKRNMDGTFSISLDGQQFTTTEQQIASFTKKVLASESELRQKNPFKALKDSLAELKNDSLLKNKLNDEKNLLTKERDSAIASGDVEKAKELNDSLDDVEESLKGINAKSATTWAKMAKQIDAVIAQVLDIGKSISSIFESFGADEDTTGTLDDIMGIVGGLGDAASGVGRIMSGDIIGGVAQGVKGIAGVISSITSLSDRKHEKQIRRLQEAINASKIAYEELGRAAAKALGNAEYDTKKLQIAELKRQQQLIQGQIKSEKDKKKTDKDKIKNWEEEYRQLGYEIEDTITEITESLTGNIKDMANEMTNALVEAFEAGDDAQEAMFKSIKNNLKQTISKQFQKTVVESALAPLFKRMNEMLGIDDQGNATYKRFTPEQVKELIGMAGDISEDVMDIFNSGGWKEIFDALTNSGELSGLSKGIQGLTEDTAQIIEAYLNTIRDVTISIMMNSENQLSVLQASQLIQSQILTEVATMSSATVSMNNALRSVIAQSNGDNGAGIRVYIK